MPQAEKRFDEGITPLKMRSLLRNLAHPYGSFKRQDIFAVLQHLGWHVRPTVGLQPVNLRYEGTGAAWRLHEARGAEDYRTEKDALRRLDFLKTLEVSKRPTDPQPDRAYLMDVRYEETPYGHSVTFGGWNAVEAWSVADPSGSHSFVLMPDRHARIKKRERIKPDDLMKWIRKDTDLPAQAKKLIDEHDQQRHAVVADTDSGTCGVCLRNLKLEEKRDAPLPVMVFHGYKRPGGGHTKGRCLGVGYPPYELSSEATQLVLDSLEGQVDAVNKYIEGLLSPSLTEFDENAFQYGAKPRIVTKASVPDLWKPLLQQHIERVRSRGFAVRRERDVFLWLVRTWKKQPLPTPGKQTVDWYGEGLKHTR